MKKIALITGATSGIGEACARKFAQGGYNLIITARRADKLEVIKSQLKTNDTKVKTLVFDVRDAEAAKNAITWEEYCMKQFGELRTHPMLRKTEEEEKAEREKKVKQPEYSKAAFEIALTIETDKFADKHIKKIFAEKFKKHHGLTPKEYIKKYGDRQDT